MSEIEIEQSNDNIENTISTEILKMNSSEDTIQNVTVDTFFDIIPSELLEKILDNLDAVTLTVAQAVCFKWKEVSSRLQGSPHYWRAACLKTIPRNCLTEVIGQAFGGVGQVSKTDAEHYNIDSLDWVDWRGVFASWGRAHKVDKWSSKTAPFTASLDQQDDVVTVVRVTGEYVVTGHGWGHRKLWNSTEQVDCPGVHMGSVTDLALLDLLHDPPYESGMRHHAVVSTGGDGCIIVTVLLDHLNQPYHDQYSMKIKQHQRSTTAVSVLGTLMTVLSEDNVVSLWSLSPPLTQTELPILLLLRRIPGPAEDLTVTSMWPNNLVFWMQKMVAVDCRWQARKYPIGGEPGMRKQWETTKEFTLVRPGSQEEKARSGLITIRSGHGENDTVDVVKQDWEEAELESRVSLTQLSRARIFHDNMYTILAGNEMFLSVDGIHYRHYNAFPHLHATVTAITVYLQFLVLGTSNGRVHIYHIPTPTQLLFLNLDNAVWWSNVARGPITSLCLGDSGDRLVLAVGAGAEVCLTKWFSEWKGKGGGLLEVKDGLGDVLD